MAQGFEVFAVCGHCGNKLPVPQVGALPKDWIAIRFGEIHLGNKGEAPKAEVTTDMFCSWNHLLTFVQSKLR